MVAAQSASSLWDIARLAECRIGHYPEVLGYLRARGLTTEDIQVWHIGYLDKIKRGVGGLYGRITFPVFGHSTDRVITISGRSFWGDTPKYWHPSFEKGRWLYGLWQPMVSIPIIVEGMFDCIALRRLGYFALGTMGTALRSWQAAHVALYSDQAVVLPHADAWYTVPRWKSALESVGIETAAPVGLYPKDAPPDADPDWLAIHYPEHLIRIINGVIESLSPKSSPYAGLEAKLEEMVEG